MRWENNNYINFNSRSIPTYVDAFEVALGAAFEKEAAEEASSKFGYYEDEVPTEDLTSLPVDRHFDRFVSVDRYRSAFVANIRVIGVGHHLDHYSVRVSWGN